MSPLYKYAGGLLRAGGGLAKDVNCCCTPPPTPSGPTPTPTVSSPPPTPGPTMPT